MAVPPGDSGSDPGNPRDAAHGAPPGASLHGRVATDPLSSTAGERLLRAAAGRTPGVGDRFGQFTLTRFLGRGSFGSVFQAEQDEPVRRTVAVKVLTGAERSAQAERRFDAERRALAALSHPGIAAIVDGGVVEDGTPWFAMELVDGMPIDAHADGAGLDARARVRLVMQACDAVDHAHRRGVLHRDLKPGNVLVRDGGVQPTVKVIDFGLAKLAGAAGDADDAARHDATAPDATAAGQALGTPAYMSPEAASLEPGRIDARSDVYSLAAIAVRLLTGAPPHPVQEGDHGAAQLARIRSEDVGPLAGRLRAAGAPRTADLEAVLRRGLARDPAARYQRPSEFAEELGRWAEGFPVRARPLPAIGRAWKFAGRHPVAVAVTAVLAVGMMATTAWALREAGNAARRRAEADARAERMRTSIEPLLNAVQLTGLAEESLGARKLLLAASEEVHGPMHPKTNSRRLAYAQNLRAARDFEEALRQLRMLLEVACAEGLTEASAAAQRINGQIADTLRMKGDTAAALALCERCVAIADHVDQGCDGNLQQARLALACLLIDHGDSARAVDEAQCAVEALNRCQPDAYGQEVIARSMVADALMAAGRTAEGREVMRELRLRIPEFRRGGASLSGVIREWQAQETLEAAERLAATDPSGAAILREAEAAAVESDLRRSPLVVRRLRAWREGGGPTDAGLPHLPGAARRE